MQHEETIKEIVSDFNTRGYDVLVGRRFSKESLENKIKEEFGFKPNLAEVDEEGCIHDYAFIGGIGEDIGYVDIYFLRSPYAERNGDPNDLYITEVSASLE